MAEAQSPHSAGTGTSTAGGRPDSANAARSLRIEAPPMARPAARIRRPSGVVRLMSKASPAARRRRDAVAQHLGVFGPRASGRIRAGIGAVGVGRKHGGRRAEHDGLLAEIAPADGHLGHALEDGLGLVEFGAELGHLLVTVARRNVCRAGWHG